MKNVVLVIPKIDDLWYREQCMADPNTMSYNAGYDVSYAGYHYDTGCIDFPEDKWEDWYNTKMTKPNFYYAYILDEESNEFVGYLNFNLDSNTGFATMGIVIEGVHRGKGYMRPALKAMIDIAKEKGVKVLTDTVPENRVGALKVFYDMGFIVNSKFDGKKFGEIEVVNEIHLKIK